MTHTSMITLLPPWPSRSLSLTHTHRHEEDEEEEEEGHIIWMQPTSSPHPGNLPSETQTDSRRLRLSAVCLR